MAMDALVTNTPAKAFANLATATASDDRKMLTNLTATNNSLLAHNSPC
jgi:hypothetical protein